ncbi:hypothetical protein BK133_13285 [Paenibacillus sp. FSL H8-0548]|uniref:hypothetical protein n=1 Tax=Paenibacillus sp. FSL H8-0548 TaxID=1920422 RepID=UPI00096BED26|nr:hypothetical protein [Paenibacillus sp. FSL H8-0548]OMF33760.1 hypothetical protein BK133_13285 [Paenibacillus sp. FSL H8-0548]
MTEWLESKTAGYDNRNETINVLKADFDQDGVSEEWVTVLRENVVDKQSGKFEHRVAYGIYIAFRNGEFDIQSFDFPDESFGRADVKAVEDLTGDGRPEVVWVSFNSGAHTTIATYTISTWSDEKLNMLENGVEIANVSNTEIQDGKLILTGGLIGSVGAGPWQREYTDTYKIQGDMIKRIDRVFAAASTPYHRFIDGLWSEVHGHSDRALQYYTEAAVMKAASYKEYNFIFDGEWVEGNSMENACASVKKAAGYDDAWLPYLNAPAGYANPIWAKAAICSGIDELEQ